MMLRQIAWSARRGAAALCIFAAAATAQDMEVMGTVNATIAGTEVGLWVPYLRDRDEPYAFLGGAGLMAVLSVDAFSGTPGAVMENPRLSLGLMRPGPQAVPTGLQLFRAGEPDRVYVAEGAQGIYRIGPVTVEGETISLAFDAVAVATDMTTFEPIAEADPIEIDGRVTVTLTGDGS